MTAVIKTPLPQNSTLWTMVQPGDFIDGYAVASDLSPSEAARIGLSMPTWANVLLSLRNKIVGPFGLKTESDAEDHDAIFPVNLENEREVILGTDDIHLNFRIAVVQQDGKIHMSTWVHRNNWFGRAYLAIVMPFHIVIVRNAMSRIGKAGPIASIPLAQ